MSREFEYYRVHRKNDNSIPLLKQDAGCPDYLYEDAPIENPELMLFKLGLPVPKKPKMADYLPEPDSIISKKIFDVLAPKNIEGIQLIPARIRGKNDEIFTDYWAIHIYHHLRCVDADHSDCIIDDIRLRKVKNIVLDRKILGSVPLDKRLIFRLKEDNSYQLFHVSVVEDIMATNPDGIKFTNIEKWHEGSFFDD